MKALLHLCLWAGRVQAPLPLGEESSNGPQAYPPREIAEESEIQVQKSFIKNQTITDSGALSEPNHQEWNSLVRRSLSFLLSSSRIPFTGSNRPAIQRTQLTSLVQSGKIKSSNFLPFLFRPTYFNLSYCGWVQDTHDSFSITNQSGEGWGIYEKWKESEGVRRPGFVFDPCKRH